MGNSTELTTSTPRDIAVDLRKAHPALPEIWESSPSKNPAARSYAYRVYNDIKKGMNVSVEKMEWYQLYTKASIRKKTTTIEEEEINFEDIDSTREAQQLIPYLLKSIIEINQSKDNLHKMYQDIMAKEREEFIGYVTDQNKAQVDLLSKDKDKNLVLIASVYKDNMGASQKLIEAFSGQQSKLFDSVGNILQSSHGLTEKYFNSLKDVISKLEGRLLEDFVRMVIFPLTPALIPLLFKLLKIQLPEGLLDRVGEAIKAAGSVDEEK